ncbi:hypothetical protein LUZ60_011662 [Juncus effusus]|nr:hypothetical protein LUZ60_011662 [Juncus effusus]
MAQQQSSTTVIPVAEQFWALVDKADRRFSRVRDLPIFGRNRNDLEFHKAFKIYTQLWKMQQENRQKLTEAGMKRWEVGEIASRIAQLYYGQYQRTADSACLAEAYVFYEAILDRDYFRDNSSNNNTGGQEMVYINKQLRFLARFVTVCLVIGRKEMVLKLSSQLKSLLDDSRKFFQDAEFKQWKHVIQEISRFMKLDTTFMNKRPLRYSYLFDLDPNSLSKSKRGLALRDSVLSSHYPNEVKFTELSIDMFRMLQSLEWDPSGSFAQQNDFNNNINNNNESGAHKSNLSLDLKDHSLPPNPLKTILYRPSVSHFLTVLATKCEELPSDGILLIYLSAEGDYGGSSENFEKLSGNFRNTETNPNSSEPRLYLGFRTSEGSSYIYPCDLIPFTRRPLFLIIDSPHAHAFKEISGQEKGETAAMLLSPAWRHIAATSASDASDPARKPQTNGSQFTVFLTAPLQAFWLLVGKSASDFDTDKYNEAEKLLCESLSEFEKSLIESSSIDPIWIEVLGDPFLRRFLLRFIFCRAAIGLFKSTSENDEFAPTCYPLLPESVKAESVICRDAIKRLASFLDVIDQFNV